MESGDVNNEFMVPSQFELRSSGTDPTKLGIWCKEFVRRENTFGPFVGEKVNARPKDVGFMVHEVYDEDNKVIYYLDGSNPEKSNWLRHLRRAEKAAYRNVISFQSNFNIFFRALRDILPGEELLHWKVSGKKSESVKRSKSHDGNSYKKKHTHKTKKNHNKLLSSSLSPSSSGGTKHLSKKAAPVAASAVKSPKREKSGSKSKSAAVPQDLQVLSGCSESGSDAPEKLFTVSTTNDSTQGEKSSNQDDSIAADGDEDKYTFKLEQYHIVKSRQGKKIYKCDVCTKAYRYAFSLKRHFLRNHVNYKYLTTADLTNCNISLSAVGSSISASSLTASDSSSLSVPGTKFHDLYHCRKCGVFFPLLDQLKSHFSSHPDNCEKQPRRYTCNKCDMCFLMKQNLKRHLIVHSGEKRFKCQYCPKAFPTQANRKRHERIHEGVKPYTCKYCVSAFTQSGDLRKHIKKQHPDNFHLCNFCPKYFDSKTLLRKHLLQHGETLKTNKFHAFKKVKNKAASSDEDSVSATSIKDRVDENASPLENSQLNPRKKYLCTICRQRFVTYSSMCRHREEVHPSKSAEKQQRPSSRSKVDPLGARPPGNKMVRNNNLSSLSTEAEFYMNIASKIADNLLNHVDGKSHQLHLKPPSSDNPVATSSLNLIKEEANTPPHANDTEDYDNDADDDCDGNSDYSEGKKESRYSVLELNKHACTQYYASYDPESPSDNGNEEYYDSPSCSRRNSESSGSESAFSNRNDVITGASRNDPPSYTYICSTCSEIFHSLDVIEDHKLNNHPNVICTHIEIEGCKNVPFELLRQESSPYGLLGHCTVLLPPVLASERLVCTKCKKFFTSVAELHLHILECGIHSDFKRQKKHRVRVSRKKGRPTKQLTKIILHRSKHKNKTLDGNKSLSKGKKPIETPVEIKQEPSTSYPDQKSPSPKKTFSCTYCGKMFKYLKAFERHTRGCSIRSRMSVPEINHRILSQSANSSDTHKCKYCHCIYKGSLKQHVASGCLRAKHKTKKMPKALLSLPAIECEQKPWLEQISSVMQTNPSADSSEGAPINDKQGAKDFLEDSQKGNVQNSPKPSIEQCLNNEFSKSSSPHEKVVNDSPAESQTSSPISPTLSGVGLHRKVLPPSVTAIREKLTEKLNRGLKQQMEAREKQESPPAVLSPSLSTASSNKQPLSEKCDNGQNCDLEENLVQASIKNNMVLTTSELVSTVANVRQPVPFSDGVKTSFVDNGAVLDRTCNIKDCTTDLEISGSPESNLLPETQDKTLEHEKWTEVVNSEKEVASEGLKEKNLFIVPSDAHTQHETDKPSAAFSQLPTANRDNNCSLSDEFSKLIPPFPKSEQLPTSSAASFNRETKHTTEGAETCSDVIFEKSVDLGQKVLCETNDISHVVVDNCPSACDANKEANQQIPSDTQPEAETVKPKLKNEKDGSSSSKDAPMSNTTVFKPAPSAIPEPSSLPAALNPSPSQPYSVTPRMNLSPSFSTSATPTHTSMNFSQGISNSQQKHTCASCLRSFAYLANYRKHLKEVCPVRRQQMEEESRKSGAAKTPKESTSTVPLSGIPSSSSRGQIERSVIGLLREQSHQQELLKNCTSRFCKYECRVCHKIFFNVLKLMQHSMSHKLDAEGTSTIKQEEEDSKVDVMNSVNGPTLDNNNSSNDSNNNNSGIASISDENKSEEIKSTKPMKSSFAINESEKIKDAKPTDSSLPVTAPSSSNVNDNKNFIVPEKLV